MKKIELAIGGMHCVSCSMLISKKLAKLDGMAKANVSYATGKGIIDYDEKN